MELERVHFGTKGYVFIDDQFQYWWVPESNRVPQLLADCDSLCGISFFNTGPNDPLKFACDWHDKAYRNRAQFEAKGFNRESIDRQFLSFMLQLAEGNNLLIIEAKLFYLLVRLVGRLFYYRHPGYQPPKG